MRRNVMIRTQISLDAATHGELKVRAEQQGISIAELVRRAVAEVLESRTWRSRPWMRYAGVLASGGRKASVTADDMVYGRRRP